MAAAELVVNSASSVTIADDFKGRTVNRRCSTLEL